MTVPPRGEEEPDNPTFVKIVFCDGILTSLKMSLLPSLPILEDLGDRLSDGDEL